MSRYKSIFKNTLIFSLSTFGSKAVSLALIPMYSYCLTLSEFGKLDITLTLILLLMPFISGSLYESVQKYNINKYSSRESILSSAFIPFLIIALTLGLIVFLTYFLFFNDNKLLLFYWILIASSIYEFFSRYAKGVKKEINFAISNILVSLVLLLCSYIFVYKLSFNIEGVLLSQALAYTSGVICLYFWMKLKDVIKIRSFDVKLLKVMLKLSAPLMLNAAMWWIFDVSDRWIILYFENAKSVGLYSVACKLGALLLLVHSIIFQAWQISAISHVSDIDKKEFYASASTLYMIIIFTVCSVLIMSSKFILESVLSNEYAEAWLLGNILLVGSAFFSLASFFGVFYLVFEKTSRALYSSIMAAIINIIANFLLIPYIGIVGAALSTVGSTLFLLVFRIIDIHKLCNFQFNRKLFLSCTVLLLLQVYISSLAISQFSFLITFSFLIIMYLSFKNEYNSVVGKHV
jgi:O-antigen/teichoic acid export membrane protein